MLEVTDLKAYYGAIMALKGVSFKVEAGALTAVIGANGAGKSTLLKSVSGLIRSKTGRIVFEGRDITRVQPGRIVALGISQVPEGRRIFAPLTVEDNLNLGAYLNFRRQRATVESRKQDVFEIFPILRERLGQVAGTLSGGEQQMLAIARAIMARPRLLLLDEPSTGLAPLVVREIFQVIRRLNREGVTIVLVEQNARAALRLAQHGYVLETGRLTLEGPTERLSADENVKRAYLGA